MVIFVLAELIVATKLILLPLTSVSLRDIKLPTLVSNNSSSLSNLTDLSNSIVILVFTGTPASALIETVGGLVGVAVVNDVSDRLIALSEESSTSALMAAYIVCELEKSLVGSIVMIVLAVLIVASKEIFAPLESVSLRMM